MNIEVSKLTDERLLRIMNEATTGEKSCMSLMTAYRLRHSTIRTQLFLVKMQDIPQYVAYHLRTHFSLYPNPTEYGWIRSKRTDRGGTDFREVCENLEREVREGIMTGNWGPSVAEIRELPNDFDRYARTNMAFIISAEGLMNVAEKRLCLKAVSSDTREVVEAICELVEEIDPDLYPHLKKPCVLHGVCREGGCGYMATEAYKAERAFYKSIFKPRV